MQTLNFFRSSLAMLTLLAIASVSHAWPPQDYRQYPPSLSTPEEITQYIYYIHQTIPEAFEPGTTYYVDPTEVIRREQAFLNWLRSSEARQAYENESPKNRRPFKKIAVSVSEPQVLQIWTLTEAGAKHLRTAFNSIANQFHDDTAVKNEMVAVVKSMDGTTSEGLVTGMIQCLPPQDKGAAFRLPPDQRLEFVLKRITDAEVKARFRSTVFKPEELTVSKLTQEYQRLDRAEKNLADLALYREWKNKGGTDQAFSNLAKLEPAQIEASVGEVRAGSKYDSNLRFLARKVTETRLREMKQSTQKNEWIPQTRFTIEEVSPHIGIYGGCLNGSCTTEYSYGFVYSPSERAYRIRDEEGRTLAIVTGTEVKLNGKESLYINEVGSGNLSPDYGAKIFRAFYAAREELGYSQIVLGEKTMHWQSFQESAVKASQPTKSFPIEYLDPRTRVMIGRELVNQTGKEYARAHDLPGENGKGRAFIPVNSENDRIDVEVSDYQEPVFSKQPLPLSEKRALTLEFLSRGHGELAESIYESVHSDHNVSLTEIENALLNTKKATVSEYYHHLKDILERSGLGWDPQLVAADAPVLAQGFLNSSDCCDTRDRANLKKAVDYVQLFSRSKPDHPLVKRIFAEYPLMIYSPAFEKQLAVLLKNNEVKLEKAEIFIKYFTAHPPLSSAVQDLLYHSLEVTYPKTTPAFITEALATAERQTPTADQLELLAQALTHPESRDNLLNLIDARPETIQGPVKKELSSLIDDPAVGDRVVYRLLVAGDRSPEVLAQAKRWQERSAWSGTGALLKEISANLSVEERKALVSSHALNNRFDQALANFHPIAKNRENLGTDFDQLKKVLSNEDKDPLADYYVKVNNALNDLGINTKSPVFEQNYEAIARGYLNAPDCWQGAEEPVSKRTLEYISFLAEKNPGDPSIAHVLEVHPEIIRTPQFESLAASFLNERDIYRSLPILKYLTAHPPMSAAAQDLLYHSLQYSEVAKVLAFPHSPTPPQLKLLADALASDVPFLRTHLLHLIQKCPDTLREPVLGELRKLTGDQTHSDRNYAVTDGYQAEPPTIGDQVTEILLKVGDRSPELQTTAVKITASNPEGPTGEWLLKHPDFTTPAQKKDLVVELLTGYPSEKALPFYISPKDSDKRGQKMALLDEVGAALANKDHLEIADFRSHLIQTLHKAGLADNSSLFADGSPILARGYVQAADAWQGPNSPVSKQTTKYLIQLARNDIKDPAIKTILDAHPELLQSSIFQNELVSLASEGKGSHLTAAQLAYFYKDHPPLPPRIQELAYQIFETDPNDSHFSEVLKLEHQPTNEQLESFARVMNQPRAAYAYMKVLENRLELVRGPVLRILLEKSKKGFLGENLTVRILNSGVQPKELLDYARSWADKNPEGPCAKWFLSHPASCITQGLENEAEAGSD